MTTYETAGTPLQLQTRIEGRRVIEDVKQGVGDAVQSMWGRNAAMLLPFLKPGVVIDVFDKGCRCITTEFCRDKKHQVRGKDLQCAFVSSHEWTTTQSRRRC